MLTFGEETVVSWTSGTFLKRRPFPRRKGHDEYVIHVFYRWSFSSYLVTKGTYVNVTLFALTPPALWDRNYHPDLTDEETDLEEMKLGQRSHS